MAVYSMTGYAMVQGALPSGTGDDTGLQLGLEMRSVNSRFLDVSFKLGDDIRAAEPALRELVGQRLKRGKVELRAWVEGRGTGQALTPSDTVLKRLHLAQATVLQTFPQAQPLSVSQVLQWGQQRDSDTSDWPQQLLRFATEALDQLLASRQREGQRLADTLLDRTRQLRSLAQTAQPLIPQLVEQQRLRFLERWHEALGQTGLSSDAAQDRALTEATAFAIRIDVAEELTRLHAHLDEIERLLSHHSELGKRLDFIIQELHREANTLGSKSSSLELTRISVDMKVLIEQMREQVQNLE